MPLPEDNNKEFNDSTVGKLYYIARNKWASYMAVYDTDSFNEAYDAGQEFRKEVLRLLNIEKEYINRKTI